MLGRRNPMDGEKETAEQPQTPKRNRKERKKPQIAGSRTQKSANGSEKKSSR